MRRVKYLILVLGVMALLIGTQTSSNATAVLKLSDGVNTATILDSDGDGFITFSGVVGSYNINVTTGLTKPASGNAFFANMDLNSVNRTQTGSVRDLTILFSDIDYQPAGSLSGQMTMGGTLTTGQTLTYSTYFDPGNAALAKTTLLGTMSFNTTPFSGVQAFSAGVVNNPYSLTMETVLHSPNTGTVSYDGTLQGKVPEPITLILYGVGFAGAGLYRRMRKPKVKG